VDVAPTILEAAGVKVPEGMTGRSMMGLLVGVPRNAAPYLWDKVYFERERHANVREGDVGYPARAVRTDKFLYVRNIKPDRWPAGDPKTWFAVGPFGDIDGGISKDVVLRGRDGADEKLAPFYQLAAAKRPGEELFDLEKDPDQLRNVAAEAQYADRLADLRADLEGWMKRTHDPRAPGGDPAAADEFDRYPYYGGGPGDAGGTRPATRPGRANRPATR
jgi:arylsulfatase A-like enzyme